MTRVDPISPTILKQPLGSVQRGIFRLNAACSLNVVVTVHLDGPLTPEAVQAGLAAAQRAHPPLRCSIQTTPELAFRMDGEQPIPFTHVRGSPEGWTDIAEAEMNTAIPDNGPLARATWVDGAGSHALILTIHHTISDGVSARHFMEAVVRGAVGVPLRGGRAPQGLPIPVGQCLPAVARGPVGTLGIARLGLVELWDTVRWGPPACLTPDVPPQDLTFHVLPIGSSDLVLSTILHRARAEDTTVHCVLSTAMMLAWAELEGPERGLSLRFGSSVNVRGELESQIDDDLGFYVSLFPFRRRVRGTDDFWDLARTMRKALLAQRNRNAHLLGLRMMAGLCWALGSERVTPATFGKRFGEALPGSLGLTNLGRLDIDPVIGPLRLTRFRAIAGLSIMGSVAAFANTSLDDQLSWDLVYATPTFSEVRAQAFAQRCLEVLLSAVG